jgi:hypothetical protein
MRDETTEEKVTMLDRTEYDNTQSRKHSHPRPATLDTGVYAPGPDNVRRDAMPIMPSWDKYRHAANLPPFQEHTRRHDVGSGSSTGTIYKRVDGDYYGNEDIVASVETPTVPSCRSRCC